MITLYNRKNTNESLGENEKHSTGKTHHRQICRATENMTGCQWTSGICPLWRFLGEIVGDNFPAVPERWCKEEELSPRSVYEIVQGKVREAGKAGDAHSETCTRTAVCFLFCAACAAL